jgi:hypothetical protein
MSTSLATMETRAGNRFARLLANLLALSPVRHPSCGEIDQGLWRRPVAHLVRIEGVRGSNPLSSTKKQQVSAYSY